ncbi:MAG: glutaminyl-peptide cyclotransferase [Bacteroidetes bacterium]|nr:MAG: glutaminyl-peptide cyclotransferase [Bacteroidota bacterium]
MKKYLIIGLLLLAAGAYILAPMFRSKPIENNTVNEAPALFDFQENLITTYGTNITIEASILSDEVAKVEVVYDDTVLYVKNDPKGKVSLSFDGTYRGVGSRGLDLMVTMKDGRTFVDNRIVRVVSNLQPEKMVANIKAKYPHNTTSFTQGLEFYNGKLYESTGQYGSSFIAEVDLTSGKINENKKIALDATHFGEGITILNDVIYQLTWQNQKCLTYDLGESIIPKGEFPYKGEGWGITNDGTYLIMSNGTERIQFKDPNNFLTVRTIEVYDDKGPRLALNELEYIDGKLYANVWQSAEVLVIDPYTGIVTAVVDCSELVKEGQGIDREVLNGIAHNQGKVYMTGKNWKQLFEVTIDPLVP